MCDSSGQAPGNVAAALRMAGAALDFLNSPAAELDGRRAGRRSPCWASCIPS
jgi:hypothetical protein